MRTARIIPTVMLFAVTALAQADTTRSGAPELRAGPTLSQWTHRGGEIAYLFAGNVMLETPQSNLHTEIAVGAQLNAHAKSGSHQIVFGIATEAWAHPGSHSLLTGLEATTINMEPENPWRKIALWSTYKTRPDTRYYEVPADPANMNSQALRIESMPGTGFERGIVLSKYSLHPSRNEPRPILLDMREVPAEAILGWDLVAFPDGCRLRYGGNGRLVSTCGNEN
jgi:hypothetical protein